MNQALNTIVDNREGNSVLEALRRLLPQSRLLDVATGFFEIGSFLSLDGVWNHLDKIRILMGDETTKRTRKELVEALRNQSDESIEREKERDDSLTGLAAVRQALEMRQIDARIYRKAKFHAKALLMQSKAPSPVNFGIVGSSNFTEPGLTQNLELNLFTTDQLQLKALQEWFDLSWTEADEVRAELLRALEPHLREYLPFEVYCKALYEYFLGKELPESSWEEQESKVYPLLSKYQKDGYHQALKIAESWEGALICDGVGLGKTFIGLMLIEYFIHHRNRVLLVVPKSARESVWESNLRKYIYPFYPDAEEMDLKVTQHTDYGREGEALEKLIARYKNRYDVIVVDEAHHFRTPSATRSKALFEMATGKKLFLLTATPLNNSLDDLYHLINLFAQNRQDHFARVGIQRLRAHFLEIERELGNFQATKSTQSVQLELVDVQDAALKKDLIRADRLLRHVMIQRSRAYVRDSEQQEEKRPCFPEREKPRVIDYSLAKVYADLFPTIKQTFRRDQPLLSFAIYNQESFKKEPGKQDARVVRYEKQLVGLLRTLALKRFESSYKAFEATLEDLLLKMADFIRANNPERLQKWIERNNESWSVIEKHHLDRDGEEPEEEGDVVPDANLHLDPEEYRMNELLPLVENDMTVLVDLLSKVYEHLSPERDDKIQKLIFELKNEPLLRENKVAIFTEFRDTARYIYSELTKADSGFNTEEIVQIDSTKKIDREKVIKRFAPYYNCTDEELPDFLDNQIRILISTDVLSEGLNLQDANIVINYDLHWNPVRLMQRVGRVDRRIDLAKPIHHDKVYFYNFLPPQELEDILHLFKRVSGKVLRISKTLGIEAPILRPDDEVEALRLFNETYDQTRSTEEVLRLRLRELQLSHPDLFEELKSYPRRVFSGKSGGILNPRGIFAAYRYPNLSGDDSASGELRWYFYRADNGEILEDLDLIHKYIVSAPDTARKTEVSWEELAKWRKEIEQRMVRSHLKEIQAPIDKKAILVCWMEIS
jgi:superfamily II DNA or RNA helicase